MDHSTGLVFRRPQATLTADLWSIFAPPFSAWPEHTIELYPTKTEFQGKRVPCLRVREPARQSRRVPVQTQQERAPDWVDEPDQMGPEQAGRARDVDEAMGDSPRE